MSDNTESREKKPFLSEEDADQATNEMIWEYFGQKRAFKQGFDAAAEKANARIAEMQKEIERLTYWQKEKDIEADADAVSLAVAELESEIEKATKEEQKEWFNAGGMAERILWKDKVEQLEKERDELLDKIIASFNEEIEQLRPLRQHPEMLPIRYKDVIEKIEQFKASRKQSNPQ